jgi:CHAT domain-containing protein
LDLQAASFKRLKPETGAGLRRFLWLLLLTQSLGIPGVAEVPAAISRSSVAAEVRRAYFAHNSGALKRLTNKPVAGLPEFNRKCFQAYACYLDDSLEAAEALTVELESQRQTADREGRLMLYLLRVVTEKSLDWQPRELNIQAALKEARSLDERLQIQLVWAQQALSLNQPEKAKQILLDGWRDLPPTGPSDEILFNALLLQCQIWRQSGQVNDGWTALGGASRFTAVSPFFKARWWQSQAELRLQTREKSKASQALWNAYRLFPDTTDRLLTLQRLSRSALLEQSLAPVLRELAAIKPSLGQWRERALYLRILSSLNQQKRLPDEQFLQACLELSGQDAWQLRLLCLGELARLHQRTNSPKFSESCSQALKLAAQHKIHPENPVLSGCSHTNLSLLQITDHFSKGDPETVLGLCQALERTISSDERNAVTNLRSMQLQACLKLCKLEPAKSYALKLITLAERNPYEIGRVEIYLKVLTALVNSDVDLGAFLVNGQTPRIRDDTPAGWLWLELCRSNDFKDKMLKSLREATAIYEARQNSDLLWVTTFLQGLAYSCLGRPNDAIDRYTRCLDVQSPVTSAATVFATMELRGQGNQARAFELAEKAVLKSDPSVTDHFGDFLLASMLCDQKDYGRAINIVQRIEKKSPQDLSPLVRLMLANILRRAGNPVEARQQLETLFADVRLSKGHPILAQAYAEMSQVSPGADGQQYRLKAVSALLTSGGYRTAAEFAVRQAAAIPSELALELCESAWKQCLERRARLPVQLQAGGQTSALRPLFERLLSLKADNAAQQSQLIAQWRSLEFNQDNVLDSTLLPPGGARDLLEQLEVQRSRLTSFETAGVKTVTEDQRVQAKAEFLATLNRIREHNPDYETRVSVQGSDLAVLQRQLPPGRLLLQYYQGESSLFIQAVDSKKMRCFEVQVERSRTEGLVESYRNSLLDPSSDAQREKVGQSLSTLLIDPLQGEFDDCKELVILPSGTLWYVPFEALKDPQGRYLIEKFPVSYASSADLQRLISATSSSIGSLLAMAPMEDLEGARIEVDALRPLSERVLVGAQASRAALREAVSSASTVHLATHSQTAEDVNHSFLKFADGNLQLSDIYALPLRPGSLVVLSSCQSGLGEKAPRKELAALSTGFRAAGASSVISSLWPVDDDASAALFPPMYQSLATGQPRNQSLRAAKLALIRSPKFAKPSYWAAFTLLGQP